MILNKEKYINNEEIYELLLDLEMAISFKQELKVSILVTKLRDKGFYFKVLEGREFQSQLNSDSPPNLEA